MKYPIITIHDKRLEITASAPQKDGSVTVYIEMPREITKGDWDLVHFSMTLPEKRIIEVDRFDPVEMKSCEELIVNRADEILQYVNNREMENQCQAL